jgi:hypothetical protein
MCLVDCRRCGATGFLPEYAHFRGGVCFECGGEKFVQGVKDNEPCTEVHRIDLEDGEERHFARIGESMLVWDTKHGVGVINAESLDLDDAREWWKNLTAECGLKKLPSATMLDASIRRIRKAFNAWKQAA